MTDLAQAVANTAPKHPVLLASLASQGQDLLPLSGSGPFTVIVKIGDNNVVEFALPDNPTQTFTDGVQWTPPLNSSSPANITFEFSTPQIVQLTSNVVFSSASLIFPSVLEQTATVQAISGSCGFSVHTPTMRIDPQIVVTPQ